MTSIKPSWSWCLLIVLALPVCSAAENTRSFTAKDGSTLRGELVSEQAGIVTLKLSENGRLHSVALHTLSESDQQWIATHKDSSKPVATEVSQDSKEGIWGGKWDDTWPVFLTITKQEDKDDEYTVKYSWFENVDRPMQHNNYSGRDLGAHFSASNLIFKLEDNKGMLYGYFKIPRMANLVRITDENKALKSIRLEDYGWKPGAIPAAEAKREIIGK